MPTEAERNAPRKRASLACSARRARAISVTSSNVTATRRPGSGNALTEKIFRSILVVAVLDLAAIDELVLVDDALQQSRV